MENIFLYLKRSFKLSFKSVAFHLRQYICFFIAVFAIQMFFGLITVSTDTNNRIEYSYVEAEYDYHLLLPGLNSDQYYYLINDPNYVVKDNDLYQIIRTVSASDAGTFNIYIKFITSDADKGYRSFAENYFDMLKYLSDSGNTLSYVRSPLLAFERNIAANNAAYFRICLLLTVLSVFLLTALYNIRINHFKYEYGIYMTFGADFRRLFETAFWELVTVTLLTFIPSSVCFTLTNVVIYSLKGESIAFNIFSILKILPISLIISGLSVFLPMLRLSKATPMKNIIAEDNSNLVVSPRISFEMLGRKFPRTYELFSLWRFRRYNIRLYCMASLFAAVFAFAVYAGTMYSAELEAQKPQFSLDLTKCPYSYDGLVMREQLLAIDGISGIGKDFSIPASSMRSHVVFDQKNVMPFANFVIGSDDSGKGLRATNYVEYHTADAEIVQMLEKYSYKGDLSSVLTDENTVILSDSFNNTKKLKIEPGDTIRVAVYRSKIRDADYLTGNKLLKSEMRFYTYEYVEFTVGAVLTDLPTSDNLPIYFSEDAFTYITTTPDDIDNIILYDYIDLYVDQTLSADEVNSIEEKLLEWADGYGGIDVKNNHSLSDKTIERSKNTYVFILSIAFLILLISPLIWFFSQLLFYRKRSAEFNVLRAMGGLTAEIGQICRIDGIICALSGAVICALFSTVSIFAYNGWMNRVYAGFAGLNLRYPLSFPYIAVAAAVLLSALFGWLSCEVPFAVYKRSIIKTDAPGEEFSGE